MVFVEKDAVSARSIRGVYRTGWAAALAVGLWLSGGCAHPLASAFPTPAALWAEALARFDGDSDGGISREEYAWFGEAQGEFDLLNANGDEEIDAVELGAYLARTRYRKEVDLHVESKARTATRSRAGGKTEGGWEAALGAPHKRKSARRGPPDILLISMDTVRADRLSTYGYTRDTSPNLDRLAAVGTTFEHGFNPSNESIFSHTALLSGRFASEVAPFDYRNYVIPEQAMMVQEVLKAYGYETAAFVAGGHVSADFGTNQGWDTFRSELGFSTFWSTAPRALGWLDEREGDKPWLLFAHGYDAHRPWEAPGPFHHLYGGPAPSALAEMLALKAGQSDRLFDHTWYPDLQPSQFRHPGGTFILSPAIYRVALGFARAKRKGVDVSDADLAHIQAHYDASIATMDLQLGIFLSLAGAAGYLDNALVIVVSDHGEDMMDHGFLNHRTGLYDASVRVPVILAGVGVARGVRTPGLVDALDVAATILDAADAVPPVGMRGRSLLGRTGDMAPTETLYFEGVMDMIAARTATHKLIANDTHLTDPGMITALQAWALNDAHFELYDLVADPREQTNLLVKPTAESLAVAGDLRARLVAWRRSLGPTPGESGGAAPSAEAIEQIRLHGYWEMESEGP